MCTSVASRGETYASSKLRSNSRSTGDQLELLIRAAYISNSPVRSESRRPWVTSDSAGFRGPGNGSKWLGLLGAGTATGEIAAATLQTSKGGLELPARRCSPHSVLRLLTQLPLCAQKRGFHATTRRRRC